MPFRVVEADGLAVCFLVGLSLALCYCCQRLIVEAVESLPDTEFCHIGRPRVRLAVDAKKVVVVVAVVVVACRVAGSFVGRWEGVEQLLLDFASGQTEKGSPLAVQAYGSDVGPSAMASLLESDPAVAVVLFFDEDLAHAAGLPFEVV